MKFSACGSRIVSEVMPSLYLFNDEMEVMWVGTIDAGRGRDKRDISSPLYERNHDLKKKEIYEILIKKMHF
jgi:hypothetical protein